MKSLIISAITLFSTFAFAKQIIVHCTSADHFIFGELNTNSDGTTTGELSYNGQLREFNGNYHFYPAGSYCKSSDVEILSVSSIQDGDDTIGLRSVNGNTCEALSGSTIYANGKPQKADCTLAW